MSAKTVLIEIVAKLRTNANIYSLYAYEAKDTSADNFIVYNHSTVSNNKAVRTDYVKFNITSTTFANCLTQAEYIEEALLTFGDYWFSDSIVKIEETGGNMTYNDETNRPHLVIAFNITSRA